MVDANRIRGFFGDGMKYFKDTDDYIWIYKKSFTLLKVISPYAMADRDDLPWDKTSKSNYEVDKVQWRFVEIPESEIFLEMI